MKTGKWPPKSADFYPLQCCVCNKFTSKTAQKEKTVSLAEMIAAESGLLYQKI
jgi:hypothetical protein